MIEIFGGLIPKLFIHIRLLSAGDDRQKIYWTDKQVINFSRNFHSNVRRIRNKTKTKNVHSLNDYRQCNTKLLDVDLICTSNQITQQALFMEKGITSVCYRVNSGPRRFQESVQRRPDRFSLVCPTSRALTYRLKSALVSFCLSFVFIVTVTKLKRGSRGGVAVELSDVATARKTNKQTNWPASVCYTLCLWILRKRDN